MDIAPITQIPPQNDHEAQMRHYGINLLHADIWTIAYKGAAPSNDLLQGITDFSSRSGWTKLKPQQLFYPCNYTYTLPGESEPRYFIKQKSQLPVAWAARKIGLPLSRGYISMFLELKLADTIQDVIKSSQIQTLIKRLGFNDFKYAEPICAFQQTEKPLVPRKYLVYPYVSGETKPKGKYQILHQICDQLAQLLKEKGIYPHDLAPRQFIIDKADNLWLIDTEGYEPM